MWWGLELWESGVMEGLQDKDRQPMVACSVRRAAYSVRAQVISLHQQEYSRCSIVRKGAAEMCIVSNG